MRRPVIEQFLVRAISVVLTPIVRRICPHRKQSSSNDYEAAEEEPEASPEAVWVDDSIVLQPKAPQNENPTEEQSVSKQAKGAERVRDDAMDEWFEALRPLASKEHAKKVIF